MTTEYIALAGILLSLLSVLTYFAGVQRTERKNLKNERSARIQKVLDNYMSFRRNNNTSGLDGLKKEGVATLSTDEEIIELISILEKHGETNPLGYYNESISKVGLKKFFDSIANMNSSTSARS